jgi:hypothetical protein
MLNLNLDGLHVWKGMNVCVLHVCVCTWAEDELPADLHPYGTVKC